VRGSRQGESHGGVYLVDFVRERAGQVLDWNTMGIDWQGRGWDRGLRGIAFDGDTVYIAASDELFAYTREFDLVGSWRNRYLRHCHEIARHERTLFLTSTGYDSIVGFDLDERTFSFGLHLVRSGTALEARPFDPLFEAGPQPSNALHLNSVCCTAGGLYVSGLRTGGVWIYNGRDVRAWVSLPQGTHNAQPFRDGVLFNDTESDVVRYVSRDTERVFRVPRYPADALTHVDPADTRLARQAFARGLCVVDAQRIAGGSSPSTITLHSFEPGARSRMATLTHDVRNAIHGLQVWPYAELPRKGFAPPAVRG
jgi:hypothetical protein